MSLIKETARAYEGMKVLIASATMNLDLFVKFFDGCETVSIVGRNYPVEVIYRVPLANKYLEEAINLLKDIFYMKNTHKFDFYEGHILVFLTSFDDIQYLHEALY